MRKLFIVDVNKLFCSVNLRFNTFSINSLLIKTFKQKAKIVNYYFEKFGSLCYI